MRERSAKLAWVAIYAIAMGYLEAAVVVYLRRIYYPRGFTFPLARIDANIALIEVVRELATIVMLASVGIIAGKNRGERFAYFIYAFGIWDIVYYLGLKATIGWPPSLLTWDILFLFPVPWVGPVIAPCIVAATMIVFGLLIVRAEAAAGPSLGSLRSGRPIAMLVLGTAIMLVSFMSDWTIAEGPALWRNIAAGGDLVRGLDTYVPHAFPWTIFAIGEAIVIAGVMSYASAAERHSSRTPGVKPPR